MVCSSAVRARQTWRLVAAEFDPPPRARFDDRVYAASARDLIAVARELPDTAHTVLLVGHNPGLEDVVEELAGSPCELRTSSIAVLSGTGSWSEAGPGWARLDTVETPRP